MSTVLNRPTVSRWGRSSYETPEHIAAEKKALLKVATPVSDNTDAEIVVVHSKLFIAEDTLQKLPSAKMIITTTSGYEHLNLPLLQRNGIRAARMPLVRRDAVVCSTLSMILDAVRKNYVFRQQSRLGYWSRSDLPTIQPKNLEDTCVGVVGHGVIGRKMTDSLRLLGCKVVVCDPADDKSIKFADLPTTCDVVSLHCSYSESNHQMVNVDWLSKFSVGKPGVLINTARGKLIDIDAAVKALDDGRLCYLGLDVFPTEPFSDMGLVRGRPNLFITPHSAGYHPHIHKDISANLVGYLQQYRNNERLTFEL